MKAIKVIFQNDKYNYFTDVNPKVTQKDIESYFIGKKFNLGVFPVEDMQECINVEFLN